MDCLDESGHLHLVVILAIVQLRVNLNGMEIFRPFVFADVLFLYVKLYFFVAPQQRAGIMLVCILHIRVQWPMALLG
jgi:hypothetical protein